MDLVREILLKLETEPFGYQLHDVKIEGRSEEEVSYHIRLLHEAGLVEAEPLQMHGQHFPNWQARTITWDGHEFLDSARDLTRWEKAKSLISNNAAPLTLEALKTAFSTLIRSAVTGA